MRTSSLAFVALVAPGFATGVAHADPAPAAPTPGDALPPTPTPTPTPVVEDQPLTFHLGGYLQPQLRFRQDSPASGDEDGFSLRRARLIATAHTVTHAVDVSATVETELTPQFALLDAYLTGKGALPGDGSWRLDAGQVKAPFSRQDLLSDAVVGFVEKAQIAGLAPDRQIGLRGAVEIPGAPIVQLWGGIFNGEGLDQPANLDEHFMYVGRVEIHPLGRHAKLAEGAFEDQITIGANVMQNTRDESATTSENDFGWGGDVSAAWKGIYGTFEYLQIDHRFPAGDTIAYHSNGFVAEATYLLPLGPCWNKNVEVGGRVEEIDRNDSVPVDNPGDPNQSERYYTGNLTYYHGHHGHDMKAQVSYSHIVEIEDKSRTGADITYPNDTLLLQLTLRME